jgi:hypothetical protein
VIEMFRPEDPEIGLRVVSALVLQRGVHAVGKAVPVVRNLHPQLGRPLETLGGAIVLYLLAGAIGTKPQQDFVKDVAVIMAGLALGEAMTAFNFLEFEDYMISYAEPVPQEEIQSLAEIVPKEEEVVIQTV